MTASIAASSESLEKRVLGQPFGATKGWSPAGARPGALHRIGEALARQTRINNDRFEPEVAQSPHRPIVTTIFPVTSRLAIAASASLACSSG